MTQRELGSRLGKPHSFVYKVETGQRRIDPCEFVAWAKACRVDLVEAIREVDRLSDQI